MALASSLEAAGYQVTTVCLDNDVARGESYFARHISLIESVLAGLSKSSVVAVGHSGAGNLLALLNPEKVRAYVFLDATFPMVKSSRFGLFDDPASVQAWRALAEQHAGMLPKRMLMRFGEQIVDLDARAVFVADLANVPLALYEESIPVHADWPPARPGLYVQWTPSYMQDAARALAAGFAVRAESASHFKMIDAPGEVAEMLVEFVLAGR